MVGSLFLHNTPLSFSSVLSYNLVFVPRRLPTLSLTQVPNASTPSGAIVLILRRARNVHNCGTVLWFFLQLCFTKHPLWNVLTREDALGHCAARMVWTDPLAHPTNSIPCLALEQKRNPKQAFSPCAEAKRISSKKWLEPKWQSCSNSACVPTWVVLTCEGRRRSGWFRRAWRG